MAFPQTSYALAPGFAMTGQPVVIKDVTHYPASEAIPFGRFVELDDGQVRLPQATTLGKIVGVAMYENTRVQAVGGGSAGYAAGEMVPILRQGQIFVDWTGTTLVDKGAPKIRHSSTTSTHRGKVTDASATDTAGSEISASPDGVLMGRRGNSSMILVEVNLPA